jgi:hypothetical protein
MLHKMSLIHDCLGALPANATMFTPLSPQLRTQPEHPPCNWFSSAQKSLPSSHLNANYRKLTLKNGSGVVLCFGIELTICNSQLTQNKNQHSCACCRRPSWLHQKLLQPERQPAAMTCITYSFAPEKHWKIPSGTIRIYHVLPSSCFIYLSS